jgi:D-3-phosphoglycerate dehydrogenase
MSPAPAFDVFETEPGHGNPLFGLPNVVCTPHLGASTTEAQENVALQVAEQMSDYLMTGRGVQRAQHAVDHRRGSADPGPFIRLAECWARSPARSPRSPIKEIEILYDGVTAGMNTKALTPRCSRA